MPITPFLRGHAFDPDTLKNMGDAFTQACAELGLNGREDRLTEMVARHIIDLAQRGVQTKTALYFLTIEEFKSNPQ
jgi:hypothetical protein